MKSLSFDVFYVSSVRVGRVQNSALSAAGETWRMRSVIWGAELLQNILENVSYSESARCAL